MNTTTMTRRCTQRYPLSRALPWLAMWAGLAVSVDTANAIECTGRGPHMGVDGACCDTWIQISPCGFGFARDWDCQQGMAEAPPEQRAFICAQLREKDAICPAVAPYCNGEETFTQTGKPLRPCVKGAIKSIPGNPFMGVRDGVVNFDEVKVAPQQPGSDSTRETLRIPQSAYEDEDSLDHAVEVIVELEVVEEVERLKQSDPEKYRDLTPEKYKQDNPYIDMKRRDIRDKLEQEEYLKRLKDCLQNPEPYLNPDVS